MRSFVAALAVIGLTAGLVTAQPASWRLVRAGDGSLHVIADGVRHRIEPASIGDAELAAVTEGEAWGATFGPMTAAAPSAPPASGWRQVARWQGKGSKVTEPFTVGGRPWRIVFSMRDPSFGNPQVCLVVKRPDGGRVEGNCHRQDDTTYVYSGAGTFFLEISSMDEWTVTVEDNAAP